ncbi:MAG: cobyrinate a,c-diamide synthase [Hyphomicrobium sp.]
MPGLIIAAPRSGAGKTTLTLGVMRAFARQGVAVQPFKCGPDYIDPAFHSRAAGRTSTNLDTWAMSGERIGGLVARAIVGADFAIAEGVMGLFDGVGARGATGDGATADLAALLGWPVVLVLDVASQAETAAAIALGCSRYRDDITIAGVILNRVASDRHLDLILPALARIGIPVFGHIRRDAALTVPERHLGLVQAGEMDGLDARLECLADAAANGIDLSALRAAARPSPHAAKMARAIETPPLPPPGQRIALATDAAFSFFYPHLGDAWHAAGAEIVAFSPLADEAPDAAADAIWLPGGYPELHAGSIAAATTFLSGLGAAAANGRAIHGECGGYMVLGDGLVDAEGQRHAMAGLLAIETSFAARRLHLGYRRATLLQPSPLGDVGARVVGHEFHYATLIRHEGDALARCTDAAGRSMPETGSRRGSVTGTFFHVIDRDVA